MDVKRGLRIPILDLGCGASGNAALVRAIERAGYRPGRPADD